MKSLNAAFAAGLVVLLFAGLVNAGLAYSEGKGSSSAPFKGSPPVAFGSWPKYPYLPCNKEIHQSKASETYLACSENANVTVQSTGFKINVITHVGANVRVACYYNGQLVTGWPKIVRNFHFIHCSAGGRDILIDHQGPVLFWRHVSNPKEYMGFVFKIINEGYGDNKKPSSVSALSDAALSAGVSASVSGSAFADSTGLNEAPDGLASGVSDGVASVTATQPAKKAFVKKTAVKKAKPAKKVSASKRVRKLRVKKVLRKPPVKRVYRVKIRRR